MEHRLAALFLARVPRDRVGTREVWDYVSGWDGDTPHWSSALSECKPIHTFLETGENGDVFG